MTRTCARFLASIAFGVVAVAAIRSQSAPEARQAGGFSGNNWPTYLGDSARTHYSTLTQITKANVSRLQVAWSYDTGDRGEYQSNNLIVGGVLYTASPTRKVIALDAATGKEIWKWDPAALELGGGRGARQRGLGYWQNSTGGERCSSVPLRMSRSVRSTRRRARFFGKRSCRSAEMPPRASTPSTGSSTS